jgi:hypothetical protein
VHLKAAGTRYGSTVGNLPSVVALLVQLPSVVALLVQGMYGVHTGVHSVAMIAGGPICHGSPEIHHLVYVITL